MVSSIPSDGSEERSSNHATANRKLLEKLEGVTRALKTLSACNHILLDASNERILLHDMCCAIVENGGYRFAAVGYAEHNEGKSIRWLSFAGADKEPPEPHEYSWADTELGRSPASTAIRTGIPCVGTQILADPAYNGPAFDKLRKSATELGYATISAFPLHVNGEVIGTLVIGGINSDAFGQEEVNLLNEVAANLAYGISNIRTRLQHHEAQATILRLAFYDFLTGLPNRALMLEQLKKVILDAKHQRQTFALLHLEVGHFHEINKVLGYNTGDRLLQALAQRLTLIVTEQEHLARVGEAEFALLMLHGGGDKAIQLAKRLLAALQEPVDLAGLKLDSRVGIGIAVYPNHANEADALLRCANTATHNINVKWGGYTLYTGSRKQEYSRRLSLMGDLRQAITHNELMLYCQPKVTIASRCICGAETLVRWQHPIHGTLSPAEFIKLAEQAGLIVPLTRWMLETTFRQIYAWHEAGLDQAMSINLSAHDLHQSAFIDYLHGLFSTWSIDPNLVRFELTESALMTDPDIALKTLKQLKQLGVMLLIDDFGTGYSSLSYLQKLPVDGIKIDQSFVKPLLTNKDSAVIVRSTIEMAHNLGLEVIAEGVETQAVWDRLAALGCDVAQGYLISPPIPVEHYWNWKNTWS